MREEGSTDGRGLGGGEEEEEQGVGRKQRIHSARENARPMTGQTYKQSGEWAHGNKEHAETLILLGRGLSVNLNRGVLACVAMHLNFNELRVGGHLAVPFCM